MNAGRVCMLVMALGAVAMAAVYLRAEQTRCAADLMNMEARWIHLRREWWTLQARAARLRTPERIRGQVAQRVDLQPPTPDENTRPPARFAADRPHE